MDFVRLLDFPKYYKRTALLVKRISRISSIFFNKIIFILIHIYHIVSCRSVLLAWSHLSFITSVISFCCWQDTHWIKEAIAPQGSMGKVPNITLQMAISLQKYWFPSLNLIQESHDNGDSLLIFSMSGPRGFKPWWPVITLWASTGCQERGVKCDLAESSFVTNIVVTNLKCSFACEHCFLYYSVTYLYFKILVVSKTMQNIITFMVGCLKWTYAAS